MSAPLIAHRGWSARHPENTLAAFRAVFDHPRLHRGILGLECDVQPCVDGELVVFHDTEVAGRPVATLSRAELNADPAVHAKTGGAAVPTLAQLLDLAAHRATLVIELKAAAYDAAAMIERLRQLLAVYAPAGDVVLASFSTALLAAAMDAMGDLDLRWGWIGARLGRLEALDRALLSRLDYLHVQQQQLLDNPAPWLEPGLPIIAWTVNSREAAARLEGLPLAALTTDCLELAEPALATSHGFVDADRDLALAPGESFTVTLASGGCWYGHGFAHRQPLPLNAETVVNDSFAVNNIQTPLWLCSAGFSVFAETMAPLAVRLGEGQLRVTPTQATRLRLCRDADLPAVQRRAVADLGWPNPPPEPQLFGDSLFCTWTQYPRCIDQQRILDMARQIRAHDWPCSTLVIDDRWESAFGELRFGPAFPDPAAMVAELHELGFRVMLWITPFINEEAANFVALESAGLLVMTPDGREAGRLRWWGGSAGLIDLSNPFGRAWYRDQLQRLRDEVGIDGFKIDGGDAKYQPNPATVRWHDDPGASGYSDLLLAVGEEVAPGFCETRTAWCSQGRRILWRLGGKDSHWGLDNGLKATVNLGIHLGLLGYDILIPDMVPGRVQTMDSQMPLPTDEYFIRFTEAACFFPIVQFSYLPWNYAEETWRAALGLARVHRALADYLAAQARDRRAPLLRPCWYDAPAATELHGAPWQFCLGADLLVAPVVDENTVARDVVLPPGPWRDAWTGELCRGRLSQHPAPCPGIPLFVRADNRDLYLTLRAALAPIARGSVPSGVTTATYRAGLDRDLSVTG